MPVFRSSCFRNRLAVTYGYFGADMDATKDIFVISDLHMGDGGARDNFGHAGSERPTQLMAFLDYAENEGGELVIVGDLFEFWQANVSKVIVRNLDLLDRLADLKATYVLGNHDADLLHFIGRNMLTHSFFKNMTGPFTRNIAGKTFKFMHGHEVDAFNAGDTPGWGRMMAIFAGICEDKVGSPMLGNDPLESLLTRIGEWLLKIAANAYASTKQGITKNPKKELTPAQNPDRTAEMIKLYADNRKAEGYEVLIAGHTHHPGRIDNWYFNSGSWATTNNNFLRISPNGNIQLFDWIDNQPQHHRAETDAAPNT